ncbi:hypothetical protein [Bosea sp. R86505]|uniref:hypothetical protein n=1 Tax=Bosea sp. R86505 TaxID=3101710 RepID=UPI00366AB2A6
MRQSGPSGPKAETILVAQTRCGERERWLEAAGMARPAQVRTAPHFFMIVQAAVAGQGCIVGPPRVLGDLIEQGVWPPSSPPLWPTVRP